MRTWILALILPLQTALNCPPIGWRGITPLHSTCDDVKRAWGVADCTFPTSVYTLPEYRVIVQFESKTCEEDLRAFRVPLGTVTSIIVSPEGAMRPSMFGLDLSKYERREDSEIVGVEHYDSRKEGATVNLFKGYVQSLVIYPPASEENLSCSPLK